MMRFLPIAISGQTSLQYFVQATTRSSSPRAERMTVALGCKDTIVFRNVVASHAY